MKTIKVSELTGAALNWVVAKCEGTLGHFVQPNEKRGITKWEVVPTTRRYTTNWAQGGPIIERERITIVCAEGDYSSTLRGYKTYWVADIGHQTADTVYGSQGDNWGDSFQIDACAMFGSTPLEAAMRCYVANNLGDTVEVPKELAT